MHRRERPLCRSVFYIAVCTFDRPKVRKVVGTPEPVVLWLRTSQSFVSLWQQNFDNSPIVCKLIQNNIEFFSKKCSVLFINEIKIN